MSPTTDSPAPTAALKDPSSGSQVDKGTVDLPAELFGARIHRHAMWLAVKTFLNNQRQGTSKVKSRAEVSGGGVKPWRQKGTGRARAGTTRSNVWVHGGRAFGPKPRDYRDSLPSKLRHVAFCSALSVRAKEGKVTVLTDSGVKDGRTREVFGALKALGFDKSRCLLIVDAGDLLAVRAARNLPNVATSSPTQVNTYEVLRADQVLITKQALETLREVRA